MKLLLFFCVGNFLILSLNAKEKEQTKKFPCQDFEAMCVKAGYKAGATSTHKGLWVDCMIPLSEGKSINGILPEETKLINPNDLTACNKWFKENAKRAIKESKVHEKVDKIPNTLQK